MQTGYVWLGDVPPGSISTFGGIITAADWLDTNNVAKITLTHPAIPYTNYLVFAMPYSDRSSTNDNDPWVLANPKATWIYKISTTSTRMNQEFNSAGDAGRA